jgi:hypothetical protein
MRRLSVALASCLLLLSATGAAAARPTREPVPNEPLEFAAGQVCSFPVRLESPFNRQTMTTFFDRFGSPRATVVTGVASTLVTNLDSGANLLIPGGQRLSFGGDSDTFVLDANGVTPFFFFDGDANPIGTGSGLFAIFGKAHEELDLNTGFVTLFEYSGSAVDVCAALSSD